MKRIKKLLRERSGVTLVELLVSAALLCMVIAMISAVIQPAAVSVGRMEDLNNAQIIADNVLETIRSELENARGYIKCYASGTNIAGSGGVAENTAGKAVEFENEDGYAVLISAEGCGATDLVRPGGISAGTSEAVSTGRLLFRYYQLNEGKYSFGSGGSNVARALTSPYADAFYMGLGVSLSFTVSGSRAEATASVYRGNTADVLFTDTLIVDLRYSPDYTAGVTAQ